MGVSIKAAPAPQASAAAPRGVRFLTWLRKIHGWIGLWGAALGLLFGSTGILMNHRAVMKIPAAQTQEDTAQLALPSPAPQDARALAAWLQGELKFDKEPGRVKEEKPRPVAWGDKTLQQPAHWIVNFSGARSSVQADYWVGNDYVTVKRSDNNLFATLNNLHKGNGAGVGWVLLADTLGGSIVLLSLTGVLMWTQLNRRRLLGAAVGLASLALMVLLGVQQF